MQSTPRVLWPLGMLLLGLLVGAGCETSPGTTEPDCSTLGTLEIEPDSFTIPRIWGGQVIYVRGTDVCGDEVRVNMGALTWSSTDPSVATGRATDATGLQEALVRAEGFGTAEISASIGDVQGTLTVEVRKPATEASGFTVLDSGAIAFRTTDLWVNGDHAYTGSRRPCGGPDPPCDSLDGWLYVWRLGADGGVEKVDSLGFPAPNINDVKISSDGSFAVATQEQGGDANGIFLLDLSDPAAPTVVAHHTAGLENGVHNVWIERIDSADYVFVAENGSIDGGLHVLDVTDRAAPKEVALYHGGESSVHDVYVRDGLAFVSHWNAAMVIVDVGSGVANGSPENPVELGRVAIEGGGVHNAWYWPAADVVFVGQESPPGLLYVMDVSDLTAPVEVARLEVPGAAPHNFWVDEDRGILFAAWITNGLRAIDVTGTLEGDLGSQGRELGYIVPSGVRGAGNIWAPQLHDGRIYVSDIYNGLWSVRYDG